MFHAHVFRLVPLIAQCSRHSWPQVGEGWVQEFSDHFPVSTEGDIEHVAFFSQGSRWFLGVFANKVYTPYRNHVSWFSPDSSAYP